MQIKSILKEYYLRSVLILFLILIGILTKFYNGFGFEFVHNHLGGVIYVIFWILLFSLVLPKYSHLKLIVWVFSVTCLIEFTQLIHTPILEKAREYFIFRAFFGSTFNPFDFIWYLVGAGIGYIIITVLKQTLKPEQFSMKSRLTDISNTPEHIEVKS